MRRLIALPMLVTLLVAQAPTEPVISVGHPGAPDYATFVGGYLITAASSNVAIVDLSSGLTVSHLPQGSLVQALEATPIGDLIAVGTCGHEIKLWNVSSRTLVRRIALPQECAESLSFSPDGALLATGAYGCCAGGNGLQIWDVHTGTLSRKIAEGSGIRHVVFGGNGRWVAGVDDKGQARVFEWPSGRQLLTLQGLAMSGYLHSRALASRDGRYFAWLADGLRVWDVSSASELPLRVEATTAEFLDDGRLAYADRDELVAMGTPDGTPQQVSLPRPAFDAAGDIAVAREHSWLRIRRDGRLLAGTRESATVVWDVDVSRYRQLTAAALTSPTSLQWSSAGVLAWADIDCGVRGWDDRSGRPVDFANDISAPTAVRFRADGARLAIAGVSAISVVDVAHHRLVGTRELPAGVESGVAFSPDGSRLAFTASEGFSVFDANLHQRHRVSPLDANTDVEHVAFSPDGRWIAAGLRGPQTFLRVWPAGGSGTHVTLDTSGVVYGPQPPAFSADSQRLASFYRGRSMMIWATDSWNIARICTLPGTGRALAFAPQGSRLAVASDGEAAIWDADTGRRVVTLSTPGSAQMTEIAWSPDGGRVVTSADDGVLRFWNSADGRLLASLYVWASSADWLLVTPDGRLDGTDRALATVIAWRINDRVVSDRAQTERHRVPGLWQSLSTLPRR